MAAGGPQPALCSERKVCIAAEGLKLFVFPDEPTPQYAWKKPTPLTGKALQLGAFRISFPPGLATIASRVPPGCASGEERWVQDHFGHNAHASPAHHPV